MSDYSTSSCSGSSCASDCGGEGEICVPFTVVLDEEQSVLDISDYPNGAQIESLTLLGGNDVTVVLESNDFGSIHLGRLVYPYCINRDVGMGTMEEGLVTVSGEGQFKVAVTGSFVYCEDDSSCDESEDDEECPALTAGEASEKTEVDQTKVETAAESENSEESDEGTSSTSSEDDNEEEEEEEKPTSPTKKARIEVKSQKEQPKTAKPKATAEKQAPKNNTNKAQQQKTEKPAQQKKEAEKQTEKKDEAAKSVTKGDKEVRIGEKKSLGRGLAYEVLAVGQGPVVTRGKKVEVKYALNLAKGGKFIDSSKLKFRVGAGDVIPGFEKAVCGMSVNEKRRIFVPSALGYKNEKTGSIPPNSDLIFEVTLLKIF